MSDIIYTWIGSTGQGVNWTINVYSDGSYSETLELQYDSAASALVSAQTRVEELSYGPPNVPDLLRSAGVAGSGD